MSLWIVTNDWLGYGEEGVIVEAADADEALEQARQALIDHWTNDLKHWRSRGGGLPAEHAEKHIESYEPDSGLGWSALEISLPHIGEF